MAELLATLIPVLGRALVHFLWQGTLIGLCAAVALQLLRNARPQVRYAVACLALLSCVLTPFVDVLLQIVATTGRVPYAEPTTHLTTTASQPVIAFTAWPARLDNSLPWVVALWAAGTGVLSLRMAIGVAWIRRLQTTPQGPAHMVWQARLDALADRFGMKSGVALRLVDALDSPASAGWWRPVVLVPTALITRMPIDLIEALLAHELAHIRRHDYLVNLLQSAVEALLFYHPVTWWLSRRIRIERELIADQLAAQVTGEPRRLALALSELSDFNSSHRPPLHLAQAAHGGHLMSRIEQLVRPGRRAIGSRIAFPLLGLAAACIAFYAHAQIASDKPAAAPQAAAVEQATKVHVNNTPREAYALVHKGRDGITMSGSTDDLPAIENARRSLDSDFVWFRRADKAYVVTDPATVARAGEAWRESDKLRAPMEALSSQMEVHGAKMEALGVQMEKLSARHERNPAMEAASRRMGSLAEQQEALSKQQSQLAAAMTESSSEAEQEQLDRKMEALSEQQDALARQMAQHAEAMDAESERLEAQAQPKEALSRQMEEASKPMEALGEKMDVLGKQQEQLAAQAEREMQKLIDEAMDKGLAVPAPGHINKR
ncbi:MAG TPA: M56 family metallopeptidase [Lysobacter sp.]|jgi:beta-lactamase regulating signal transducer with metallopeptidase domain|nr:M56 family metallopeptidase [Lysobacter sp.]